MTRFQKVLVALGVLTAWFLAFHFGTDKVAIWINEGAAKSLLAQNLDPSKNSLAWWPHLMAAIIAAFPAIPVGFGLGSLLEHRNAHPRKG